ncbi:unnamed protein product [Prorocentrum cordatum]|uniref:ACT domain-containing protein n=1 Tax=Prorocentrum cordatum TaxID=2364126 RepID=A0ABN9PUJ2_9DINO|nr:unnamed protein product [Polarella glacialis]
MTAAQGSAEGGPVATISSKRGITMVTIRSTRMLGQHGFLANIFELFEKFGISVDVVTTSEVSVSLTLDPSDEVDRLPELRAELQSFATVEVVEGLSMVMLLRAKVRAARVLSGCFECFEDFGSGWSPT